MEGRDRLEGTPRERAKDRTQSRGALPPNLERVNQAAQRGRQTQFTALLHHVDMASLRRAFARQRRQASAGVDGETVASHEPRLDENLAALCARLHTGRYRPLPVRRRMTSCWAFSTGQMRRQCWQPSSSAWADLA